MASLFMLEKNVYTIPCCCTLMYNISSVIIIATVGVGEDSDAARRNDSHQPKVGPAADRL